MSRTMLSFFFAGSAIVGMMMVLRARKLSLAYNAWTTGVRERNPAFSQPPTPEARSTNTTIMTWIFRLLGLFIALFSSLLLLGNLAGN